MKNIKSKEERIQASILHFYPQDSMFCSVIIHENIKLGTNYLKAIKGSTGILMLANWRKHGKNNHRDGEGLTKELATKEQRNERVATWRKLCESREHGKLRRK